MNVESLNTLFDKAGGRFALAALCQKRAAALMKGAPPLVEKTSSNPFHVALAEIDAGKIAFTPAETRKDRSAA